ncbi:BAR-domain-containing protein [Auriscalpium vulgare]|uniref:BAR-domain-containing protein n=1 Tax=Auriscalpium vulgare TaxID=40419 RepID=A0ACB8RQG5_9AGAM|nr:BAR-domain-containing protein [Auriscalpium vulgare]
MKGITKAIMRTPHLMTSKVGMSKKSTDPEFDEYQRNFTTIEGATDKFLKDTKAFTEAVNSLFTSGSSFATHFNTLFHPIASEYDLLGKFPDAAHTIKNVDAYQSALEDLRTTVAPELELIESRVVGPIKELQVVMKAIRKMITKRDHKLVDYDRFNNSLTKLREKKEKSLSDEKNLFKLEQDFEIASNDYDNLNNSMKQDLPRFMLLATRFIDPLFHSFFYMQLNIFYMLLEKINQFSDGKYEVSVPAAQIGEDFIAKRGESAAVVDALSIVQRFISTSKLVSQGRTLSPASSTLGRSPSSVSTSTSTSAAPPPAPPSTFSRSLPPAAPPAAGASAVSEKASYTPPPPNPASPPPYSAGAAAAAAAAAKRAPPPPPPLKPKPAAAPAVHYVTALYDFVPQADGDLEFKTGDRIELVERTNSEEDWWTGKLNGKQGIFPGNYVQEN